MSLPWFPFHIKDFIANTRRLNTEAKGAYLCLMLDYYQQGKPPPDDDEVLATIAELPLDAWMRHRKVIEPLFEPRDGLWHHPRIEEEMLQASSKHAASSARARHAALSKAKKTAPGMPQAPPEPAHKPKSPRSTAPGKPRASPENTHLTLNTTTLTSSSSTRENDDSKAVDEFKKDPNQVDCIPNAISPLGTPLPETWLPSEADQEAASLKFGMTTSDIEAELLSFHAFNASRGTFSRDWSATWRMWCSRWRHRKPRPPAPRIDVTTSPAVKDWEYGAAAWARSQSLWPRSLGPDPLSGRCRCPPEILRAHGIDPANGGALKVEGAA